MDFKKLRLTVITILLPFLGFANYSYQPGSCFEEPIFHKNEIILNFSEFIIKSIIYTRYQHINQTFDLGNGIFLANCSGLSNFILENTFPEALEGLAVENTWLWPGTPRPRAAAYYQAFIDADDQTSKAASFWKRIPKIMNTKPGDFIAYREDSFDGNTNSGHVMIVSSYPYLLPDESIAIEVIEASKYKYSNDTRSKNGVGKGILKFYIDDIGQPIAFSRTLNSGKRLHRQIAIGRLK